MASTTDRISASGRVVRVAPKYVYIHSEQYGSVFAYPAAYFNCLPDPPTTNNLTEVLRVDDVVHFVAVPQYGQNDCRWIAIKITKRQPNPSAKDDYGKIDPKNMGLPETIRNVRGTIIELHDRNGFIYSDRYGKIYFPMAAAAESNELHPLNTLFEAGDWVLFDAQRQPCKNDCRYVALRVQLLTQDLQTEEAPAAPVPQKVKRENGDSSKKSLDMEKPTSATQLEIEEGEIARLFPQYGFIRSDSLGAVYFTLAHFESETFVNSLLEALSIGDRVQFIKMPQPEKNGCQYRGLKVKKVEPDLITPLARLVDDSCTTEEPESEPVFVCEVAVQTDQSLWNTFLATQATASYRRRDHRPETSEATCQTRMPPEALLLKAVKEDEELKAILRERFPHLMKFVEKMT